MAKSNTFFWLMAMTTVILGAALRLTGVNWDSGQHQHPDERFLSMTAFDAKWPTSVSEYFNTLSSPLNPHNFGRNFYVYGTYPWIVVKFIAEITGQQGLLGVTLTGRVLSALIDIATLVVAGAIAWRLTKSRQITLFSLLSYALFTLPIQLSHFFTVDPYVTFFTTLTIFFLTFTPTPLVAIAAGLAFGMAISAKISAIYLTPLIVVLYLYYSFISRKHKRKTLLSLCSATVFITITILTIRIALPYLFNGVDLNQKVLNNWKELGSYNDPSGWFPPSVQWINTTPWLFPLLNIIYYGIGIPFSITLLIGLMLFMSNFLRKVHYQGKVAIHNARHIPLFLLFLWSLFVFAYQGGQFVKAMRYFWVLYPILAMLIGITLSWMMRRRKLILISLSAILLSFIWAIMVVGIYTRPHTRIAASAYIGRTISPIERYSYEHWDDPLPLCIPSISCGEYHGLELALYGKDTTEKWQAIQTILNTTQYIFISSNRLYGSLTGSFDLFPITSRYYHDLFTYKLQFRKLKEFTSRPNLPIQGIHICIRLPFQGYGIVDSAQSECSLEGISIVDDYADETWTVYDHPKVTLFKAIN